MCPISIPAPSTSASDLSPSLAIPMASAVTKRRQLAPTVGQAGASTGVLIRTGPSSSSSARCASGLVFRHGVFDYVVDYASRFGAEPLPPGVILPVGSHRIFIADLPDVYPREIRVFSGTTDPLPTRGFSAAQGGRASRVCAEVMMAGTTTSSHHSTSSSARRAKEAADAATATADLTSLRDVLYTPVNLNADPAQAHAELEKCRLALAGKAEHVLAEERRLGAITREYNAAHGVQPRAVEPVVLENL